MISKYKLLIVNVIISILLFVAGASVASHAHAQELTASTTSHHHHVLRIRRDPAVDHPTINPGYYDQTHLLGPIATAVGFSFLGWVYYQNYVHRKKRYDQ